jgi:rare lipoprotein A
VTNLENGKSVLVKINDRGPFAKGRIIDLSKSAFSTIANPSSGVVGVRIEVVK